MAASLEADPVLVIDNHLSCIRFAGFESGLNFCSLEMTDPFCSSSRQTHQKRNPQLLLHFLAVPFGGLSLGELVSFVVVISDSAQRNSKDQ